MKGTLKGAQGGRSEANQRMLRGEDQKRIKGSSSQTLGHLLGSVPRRLVQVSHTSTAAYVQGDLVQLMNLAIQSHLTPVSAQLLISFSANLPIVWVHARVVAACAPFRCSRKSSPPNSSQPARTRVCVCVM